MFKGLACTVVKRYAIGFLPIERIHDVDEVPHQKTGSGNFISRGDFAPFLDKIYNPFSSAIERARPVVEGITVVEGIRG
jgi:hypothetical protein